MKRVTLVVLLLVPLFSFGCSDSSIDPDADDTGSDYTRTGWLTATIDGESYSTTYLRVTGDNPQSRQGTLTFYSTLGVGDLILKISFVNGPGTYALGVDSETTPGGTFSLRVPGYPQRVYTTPLDGESGFVTITERSDKRIAGTFNCTLKALSPSEVPQTHTVTEASFEYTTSSSLPPFPSGDGSTMNAVIQGTPFNAAMVAGSMSGTDQFGIQAINTKYAFTISTKVGVAAGNTYQIPSEISIAVTESGTGTTWWGGDGEDIGTLTITQFEPDRLVATFSGTLPAVEVASPLTITGGAIDSFLEVVE